MPSNRFEDTVSVEDLMKKPQKELLTMIYIQTVKTNGTVGRHDDSIETLENDMKDKIGIKELNRMQKIFAWITGSIALILIIFNVFDRVAQYMGGF